MVRKLDIPLRRAFETNKDAGQPRVQKSINSVKLSDTSRGKIADTHLVRPVAQQDAEGHPARQVCDNILQSQGTAVSTSAPSGLSTEVLVALAEIRNSVTAIAKDLESHKSEVGRCHVTVPTAVPPASKSKGNIGNSPSPTDLILIGALNLARESINLQNAKSPPRSKSKRNEQSQLLDTLAEIGQSLRALKKQEVWRGNLVSAEESVVISKAPKPAVKDELEGSPKKQTQDQIELSEGPEVGCSRCASRSEDTIRQSVRLSEEAKAEDSDSDQKTLSTESVRLFSQSSVQPEETGIAKQFANTEDDRSSRPSKHTSLDVIYCLSGHTPATASPGYSYQRHSSYVWQPAVAGYAMMMMPMMVGAWATPAVAPTMVRSPEGHCGEYCPADPRSRVFPPLGQHPRPQKTSPVTEALPQNRLASAYTRLDYSRQQPPAPAVQQMRKETTSHSEKLPPSKDSSRTKPSTGHGTVTDLKPTKTLVKNDRRDSLGSSDASLHRGQANHCALKLSCFC
ncbi:hypothetical protein SprV_0902776800 [Sparganum proliferum]